MKIVVGLANPGSEYQDTRHNAGAWFVEAVAASHNLTWKQETKFKGFCSSFRLQDDTVCRLLIPTTFMNCSGEAIAAISKFYKVPPESILVVHDELDLPVGVARLKKNGGHGGHNGLRDIIEKLGSKQFHRLRLGIDRPKASHSMVNYVLGRPSVSDRQAIEVAISDSQEVLPLWLSGQVEKAMKQLHTQKD